MGMVVSVLSTGPVAAETFMITPTLLRLCECQLPNEFDPHFDALIEAGYPSIAFPIHFVRDRPEWVKQRQDADTLDRDEAECKRMVSRRRRLSLWKKKEHQMITYDLRRLVSLGAESSGAVYREGRYSSIFPRIYGKRRS